LQSNLRGGVMAKHQINPQGSSKLAALDPIWDRVRSEAEDIVRREPELASFIYSTVLHHDRLEQSVVHRLAERLDHSALSGDLIRQAYDEALRDDPDLGNAFRADLVAVYDRDPATSRFIDPLLYFKGFHALQTHRLAHWLYQKGRKDFAYYLQSRSSAVFPTEIPPAPWLSPKARKALTYSLPIRSPAVFHTNTTPAARTARGTSPAPATGSL